MLTSSPAWMRDALCAEYDRELFFPVRGQTGSRAKAICARCLVESECLDYAMAVVASGGMIYGVWGGTTERERRALTRTASRAADVA